MRRNYGGMSFIVLTTSLVGAAEPIRSVDGWTAVSQRVEIRPVFGFDEHGGPEEKSCLTITADDRDGLDGTWLKTFSIKGGEYYRFSAVRKTVNVVDPTRHAVARITWEDDQGNSVLDNMDRAQRVRTTAGEFRERARPEFPMDHETDELGWTEVTGTFRTPNLATTALVELQLRWVKNGSVNWSDVSLTHTDAPPPRRVRLASVYFEPRGGKTPADNCRMFVPLIEKAAELRADLVCLPEWVTALGTGLGPVEAAEPIPGPSTKYFGSLAKEHELYIVVGLLERDEPLVYNTTVLVGPDAQLVGKYR